MEKIVVLGKTDTGVGVTARLDYINTSYSLVGNHDINWSLVDGWGKKIKFKVNTLQQIEMNKTIMVFVTVHSYELRSCLEKYLPYFPKGITIVLMTNAINMDLAVELEKTHPEYIWRVGYVSFALLKQAHGQFSISRGHIFWGPTKDSKNAKQTEEELLIVYKDSSNVFSWEKNISAMLNQRWIFDCVLNTISCANLLSSNKEILEDMSLLQETLTETITFATNRWGRLSRSKDWFFSNLVNYSTTFSTEVNPMVRLIRKGKALEKLTVPKS